MDLNFILLVTLIALALIFDFLNGFHDSANSIATVVVTRTLSPLQAILLAGCANFVGYFAFGTAIAKTVGKGVVTLDAITAPEIKLTVLFAALLGAIIWNIITWLLGLPTSSSHALIGGLVGSAVTAAGLNIVVMSGLLKIIIFIIVAPLLGMLAASVFTTLILILFRKSDPTKTGSIFKKLQLISATWYSIGHGTNDAQKTMGIIALALFSAGVTHTFELKGWIVLSCYCAIALGTMFGGWRIVKTMGTRITKIRSMEGFCAESSAALVLMSTAHFGIPVSTTHVIAGAIMGVGSVERASKVRWITARKILWAWILTIPATAACAAISFVILKFLLL